MSNKLAVIISEQGIEQSDATRLIEAFGGPFEEAGNILETYQEVVVKDEDDVDTMNEAREKRLLLKKARTTVESRRKEMKANIIREGRTIDSIARFVKEEIEPAEKYLESQERYAILKQQERAAQLKADRIAQLSKYTDDVTIYDLDNMTLEQFDATLAKLSADHAAELKRQEEERIAAEKAVAEKEAEEKRIREENERLRKEAEERERAAEAERKKAQLEQEKRDEVARKEREKLERENEKKLEAERAKAEEERKRREAIEAEQRAKEEAEARAKAEEEEKERQALLAPDRQKLEQFADALEIIRTQKLPAVKSNTAQSVVNRIDIELVKLGRMIKTSAAEL